MPEITLTVSVPWPKHPTLATLEKAIFKVSMAAGRELLKQAFRALEEEILAEGAGARRRRRRRYLGTRFGEIRFFRWQVRQQGRYGYPLDEALGIPSRDPCSPSVRATAAFLAQAHPFRQAARLLSEMMGCLLDHRRVWGWAQGSGRRVRERWEQKRTALLQDGVPPSRQGQAPAIVSTSAGGTFIHSRDGPMEVKLGMWWTGASLASETARHRKDLLQGRGLRATTADADRFEDVPIAVELRAVHPTAPTRPSSFLLSPPGDAQAHA